MAAPSLSKTLTNGNPNDADEVMTNFNDLLNGVTDGTKDLTISALTCSGTVTMTGACNFGNADADIITVDGILTLSRSNLAKTSTPVANTIYPNSIINAWALLTLGAAGAVTVTAGFNVDTATWATTDLTINFHTNMADANYAPVATVNDAGGVGLSLSPKNLAVGTFDLELRRATGAQNFADGDIVHVIVVGNQ